MSESLKNGRKGQNATNLGQNAIVFSPYFTSFVPRKRNIYGQLHFPYRTGTCFLLACNCGFGLLHCRKIVEKCNYYMAKGIREQDCLAKQLERTRIEKEMMEKVIKAELAEAVKSFMTGEKNDGCTTDCKRQISRIEITYFI